MKYKLIIFLLAVVLTNTINSQDNNTENVWRINILNPGVEYEKALTESKTLSFGAGIGYSGSYPNTSIENRGTGLVYAINPFLDIQFKNFYNLDNRVNKNLTIKNNSGNYVSGRLLMRSKTLFGDDIVTDKLDVAVGPTWGIQRNYGKNFHFQFDMGPLYYFDVDGNHGFFPLMIQLNIGFNL